MRVLVAEDDGGAREGFAHMLELLGHEPVTVADGGHAFEALARSDGPPVAILDWMMPRQDGTEVCRKVRRLPHGGERYLVLVSARSREEGLAEGLGAGADSFLAKPIHLEELQAQLEVAQRALSERTTQRRQEAYLASVLEHIGAGVLLSDADDQVVYANEWLSRWAGGEVMAKGHRRSDLLNLLAARFEKNPQLAALLAGPDAKERQAELRSERPQPVVLRWTSRPIPLPEGRGHLDVFRDVTAEAELARVLERVAMTDHLTGLFNRRGAEKSLGQLTALARRQRLPLALAMIDLDHFKRINDDLGHAVGDAVLAQVATVLRQGTRASDLVARWGGEELVLALSGASRAEAVARLESLRERVEAMRVRGLPRVTFSAGVDELEELDADFSAALERADRRLYVAKLEGRNRVA